MASFGVTDFDLIPDLEKIGANIDKVGKKAVYNGAGVMADALKQSLRVTLADSKHSTGDLEKSMGIASIDVDNTGSISTAISFSGYDRKKVPNIVKARSYEFGNIRGQKKRPFIAKAVKSAESAVIKAMTDTVHSEMDKIT